MLPTHRYLRFSFTHRRYTFWSVCYHNNLSHIIMLRLNPNQDIEAVLERVRLNSNTLANYHRKRYLTLKSRLKYYRIPIILLSSINSVASVSFQAWLPQSYISLVNMFLSLVVGIVGSIEMFYGLQKQMETELIGSKDFYILNCDIYKYLSLTPEHRTTEPQQFLQETYGRYIKLVEVSIVLKKKMEDTLVTIQPALSLVTTASTETFVDSEEGGENNL